MVQAAVTKTIVSSDHPSNYRVSAPALLAYRQHEAYSVKIPYIGIALALIALALAIAMFNLPKIETTGEFRPMGEVAFLPEPD